MSQKEKKLADAMRIFEALSGVDEELLIRCEDDCGEPILVKKPRPIWYYGKVLAACFCFVVCGAVLLHIGTTVFQNTGNSADSAVQEVEEAAVEECAVEEDGVLADIADSLPDVAGAVVADEEAKAVGGTQEEGITTEGAVEEYVAVKESATGTNEQSAQSSEKDEALIQNQQECDCLPDLRREISLEEAKQVVALGEYVPDILPAGYVFESCMGKSNQETGEVIGLSLCWTKGMDSIMLNISKVDVADIMVTDVSKPETYNVHLYDIPYADTVPDEYRSCFHNPVFAVEDFSLAVVEARIKVIEEAGDTATPRGNFALLYEEGILVEFSGRSDAESIYEMLK
ncbi:MAG: hypothetical protein E7291_10015 [Lachnospiraceae bacterium]|nr:hypothetical protein [Lachnospiraceae bacterium]